MEKRNVWIVWLRDPEGVDEEERQWDVYDTCLTQSAACRSMKEGEKKNAKLRIFR